MQIGLVRHGLTDWNALGKIQAASVNDTNTVLANKIGQIKTELKSASGSLTAIDSAFTKASQIMDGFSEALGWARDNADWLIPVLGGVTAAIVAQKVVGTVSQLYKTWTTVTKGMTVAQIALEESVGQAAVSL